MAILIYITDAFTSISAVALLGKKWKADYQNGFLLCLPQVLGMLG